MVRLVCVYDAVPVVYYMKHIALDGTEMVAVGSLGEDSAFCDNWEELERKLMRVLC